MLVEAHDLKKTMICAYGTREERKHLMADSHVQMPKFMLKRFADENHNLYYYDVKCGFIGTRGKAKSINTVKDYYSEEIENLLNSTIEDPMGKLLIKIDQINVDDLDFSMTPEYRKLILEFIWSLLCRNPKTLESVLSYSSLLSFLTEDLPQLQHDLVIVAGMIVDVKKAFFEKYIPTFTINKSCTPFVLPICGIYHHKCNDMDLLSVPISPNKAITLFDISNMGRMKSDGRIEVFSVEHNSIAHKLNTFAFKQQIKFDYGVVVSANREELDTLKEG